MMIRNVILPTSAISPDMSDPAPTLSPAVIPPTAPASPVRTYGGLLSCRASTITQSDPRLYMTRTEAAGVIGQFCNVGIRPGVVFSPYGGTPFQYARADGPFAYPMLLAAVWIGGSDSSCPTLDFSNSTSSAQCQKNLLSIVIDQCERGCARFLARPTADRSSGNTVQTGQFWKGGGTFEVDCIAWSIKRADAGD